MRNEIREAASRMVMETASWQAVADRARARFGWICSERAGVSRVSQWMSPSDPHQLPADMLGDIIEVTGRDEITPILLRRSLRVRKARPRAKQRRERA